MSETPVPDPASPPPDSTPRPVPPVQGLAPGTVADWRRWAAAELAGASDSPEADADVLLASLLGLDRGRLALTAGEAVEAATVLRLASWIERRRLGEPVAYITGSQGFWTLDLAVDTRVLIPRPDTETLVERALAIVRAEALVATPCGPEARHPYRIADLGTGSGAIALALAAELPEAIAITATDVSPAALAVAGENARRLRLDRVRFLEGAWFAALPAEERFELIVSNPPYIADGDRHLAALRYEPRLALTSGADGLDAIRELVGAAAGHLAGRGWLLLEHGHDQGSAVRALLTAAGFTDVETQRDFGGHERVSGGRRP